MSASESEARESRGISPKTPVPTSGVQDPVVQLSKALKALGVPIPGFAVVIFSGYFIANQLGIGFLTQKDASVFNEKLSDISEQSREIAKDVKAMREDMITRRQFERFLVQLERQNPNLKVPELGER